MQANFSKAIYNLISTAVLWLSVLPAIAEEPILADPIVIDQPNALELLEAEIIKNQNRTIKPKPKSPSPSSSSNDPPKSESAEESLPIPVRPKPTISPTPPFSAWPLSALSNSSSPTIDPSNGQVILTQNKSGQTYLGLTLQKPSGNLLGLRVMAIADRSPAWKSGFVLSDRVLAVADQAVSSIEDFAEILSSYSPGDSVRFLVDRGGRKKELISILMDRQLADQSLPGGEQLMTSQPVTNQNRSDRSFGVALAPLSLAFRSQFGIPAYRGASVLEVRPNSPASQAGLSPGDCIVELNGQLIASDRDALRWQYEGESGTFLPISFYRGGALIQSQIAVPNPSQIIQQSMVQDLPLGATVRPQLTDEVQRELHELRQEVQRLRDELRASQDRR